VVIIVLSCLSCLLYCL